MLLHCFSKKISPKKSRIAGFFMTINFILKFCDFFSYFSSVSIRTMITIPWMSQMMCPLYRLSVATLNVTWSPVLSLRLSSTSSWANGRKKHSPFVSYVTRPNPSWLLPVFWQTNKTHTIWHFHSHSRQNSRFNSRFTNGLFDETMIHWYWHNGII